jgi:hypothetical protein
MVDYVQDLLLGVLSFALVSGRMAVLMIILVIVGRSLVGILKTVVQRVLTKREKRPGVSLIASASYALLIVAVWLVALVLFLPPWPVPIVVVTAAGLDVLICVRESRRRALALAVGAMLLGFGVVSYAHRGRPAPRGEPVFAGPSSDLEQTQVVATLDVPMEEDKNIIWCVSFQAAWKALQRELAGGPVALAGDGSLVDSLNAAYVPGSEVPDDCLYTATGWEDEGVVEMIAGDLARRFPDKEAPEFRGIIPGSFVAYSYLEARVRFRLPYFQSVTPLTFTARDGNETEVSSFGIRPEDDYAYKRLRDQPHVLFSTAFELDENGGVETEPKKCIVDLDHESRPSQIIVAMVEPRETLAETLVLVEEKIAGGARRPGLGINDVLLVPDVVWRITHHFADLEGREFQNPALKGQRMDVAQQDISFRLDRYGAELRSEAKMYCLPIATHYVFDRPFLILMRKRGQQRPYFVMWVGNAELLRPFDGS